MAHSLDALLLSAVAPDAAVLTATDRKRVATEFRSSAELKRRQELTFNDVSAALIHVESLWEPHTRVFWSGYDIDREPCLEVEVQHAIKMIRRRNTVLSLDGFVLINSDYKSGVIVDYEEAIGPDASGEVYVSLLGAFSS